MAQKISRLRWLIYKILNKYKIADKLKVCIGLDTSVNKTSKRVLDIDWEDVFNNKIIKNICFSYTNSRLKFKKKK